MTLREFLEQISMLYEDASKTTSENPKVRRGRSRSIAAEAEDLFAELLVANDSEIEMIRVDQPITIPTTELPGKKSFQVYPDVVVIKGGKIRALIDLKMDLGWNRDGLIETCEKHNRTVRLARGNIGKLKDGQTKLRQELMFSDDLTYSVVLVSGKNINSEKLTTQIAGANSIADCVQSYVLSDGLHPNGYWLACPTFRKKLMINDSEFDLILKRIN